jgi:hypothetical protein
MFAELSRGGIFQTHVILLGGSWALHGGALEAVRESSLGALEGLGAMLSRRWWAQNMD